MFRNEGLGSRDFGLGLMKGKWRILSLNPKPYLRF